MYFLLKAEKTTRVASNILAKILDETIYWDIRITDLDSDIEIQNHILILYNK